MTFRFSRMCAFGLAACGLFLSAVGQACERCQRSSNHQCSCQRDDRGLLHMVDAMAGNLHQGIKGLAGSGRDKKAGCGCASCQSRCDTEPNCGVEPRLGVPPTCGCEATSSNRYMQPSPPAHVPSYSPAYPAPQYLPPVDIPPVPKAIPTHKAIPIPAPLPDVLVDPFQDEDAEPRRMPARTIQYRRPAPHQQPVQSPASYGRRFDDQAGVMTYRIGDGLAGQIPTQPVFGQASYPSVQPSVAPYRRPIQARPIQSIQPVQSEVVPVSAVREQAVETRLRPVSNDATLQEVPVQQAAIPESSYYNPLR